MVCFLLWFWFSFNIQEGKAHRVIKFINNFLRCAEDKQASSNAGDVSEEGYAFSSLSLLVARCKVLVVRTVKLLTKLDKFRFFQVALTSTSMQLFFTVFDYFYNQLYCTRGRTQCI